MRKFKEAAISVAAGTASIPLFLGMGSHTAITIPGIEACAGDLQHPNPNSQGLPPNCYNGTQTVFPYTEFTYNVVSSSNQNPEPVTGRKYELLSPDEYRHLAYELLVNEETKDLLRGLGSIGLGIGVGALVYYETAINTAERRAANQ